MIIEIICFLARNATVRLVLVAVKSEEVLCIPAHKNSERTEGIVLVSKSLPYCSDD